MIRQKFNVAKELQKQFDKAKLQNVIIEQLNKEKDEVNAEYMRKEQVICVIKDYEEKEKKFFLTSQSGRIAQSFQSLNFSAISDIPDSKTLK